MLRRGVTLLWLATALALFAIAASCAREAGTQAGGVDASLPQATAATSQSATLPDAEPRSIARARTLAANDARLTAKLAPSGDGWLRDSDGVTSPGWRSAAAKRFDDLGALLPEDASGDFAVGFSTFERLRLHLRAQGARPAPLALHAGRATYEDAYPSTDVMLVTSPRTWEELLVLRDASAPTTFVWSVDLPSQIAAVKPDGAGGLRFEGKRDAVLHAPRPYAIDARGTRRDARLSWTPGALAVEVDTTGLAFPILLDPGLETGVWTQLASGVTPARLSPGFAFDTAEGVGVLVGGTVPATMVGNNPTNYNDTWLWNGTTWKQATPTTAPSSSGPATAAYDYDDQFVLVAWPPPAHAASCATNLWNGTTWSAGPSLANCGMQLSSGGGGAVGNGTLVYVGNHTMLLLGGASGAGFNSGNLVMTSLVYDPSNGDWTVSGAGASSSGPSGRFDFGAAYDSVRGRLVVFGGYTAGGSLGADTWEYDVATGKWQGLCGVAVDGSASSTCGPDVRENPYFAFDSLRGRTVLFGGDQGYSQNPFTMEDVYDSLADTWEWDGTSWTLLDESTPSARTLGAAAFDPVRREVVAWGGAEATGNTSTLVNETWGFSTHGESCTTSATCDTGICDDGVCCETGDAGAACPVCQQCNRSPAGVCTNVPDNIPDTDPNDHCPVCNGSGECKGAIGVGCDAGAQCQSTFCANGACCNTACTGACFACDVPDAGGTCSPISAGATPVNGTCATGDAGTCGSDGKCDGEGNCQYWPLGTTCAAPGCNGSSTATFQCNGFGGCNTVGGASCAPFACTGGACLTSCSSDGNCATGDFCAAGGTCEASKSEGAPCNPTADCASPPCNDCAAGASFCVDGHCCNSACSEPCQVCAQSLGASADGVCTVAPYEYSGTTDAGVPAGGACAPYVCPGPPDAGADAGTACKSSCAADTDCATGFYCNASGACAPQKTGTSGATCSASDCKTGGCRECASGACADGYCCSSACAGSCDTCAATPGTCTQLPKDSPSNPSRAPACAPYTCPGGGDVCASSCASDNDCASGFYCAPGGTCTAEKTQGSACNQAASPSAGAECLVAGCRVCATGSCADGYCCNSACAGSCDTCAATPGTCSQLPKDSPSDPAKSPACSPYTCPGGSDSCSATCASDADCATGFYCNASGQCAAEKSAGAAASCSSSDCKSAPCRECGSAECVDGFCCASACAGECQACDVSGAQGACTPVTGAPHGSRPQCGGAAACATPTCNGSNVTTCAGVSNALSGTSCGPNVCSDGGAVIEAQRCDGNGNCAEVATANCDPSSCSGAACTSGCTADSQCAGDAFCNGATCADKQPNGATCTKASACTTGNCVDGYCCSGACGGECQACDVNGVQGTCAPVTGPPHGARSACPAGAGGSCTVPSCDGNTTTSCQGSTNKASGTSCGANVCSGTAVEAQTCNGSGTCTTSAVTACDPFPCASGACATSCAVSTDCAGDGWCSGGKCATTQTNGTACTQGAQCQSHECVDGYCCASACGGECQACDVTGALGACVPVAGAPHGARAACTGGTACASAVCDGTNVTSCTGTLDQPKGTSCGPNECSGTVVVAQQCDGAGSCAQTPTATNCDPFPCANAACAASCTSDASCASDGYCSGGVCVAKAAVGATCTASDQCATTECVDGYCCNTACGSQCQACDVNGLHGTCAPVTGQPHGARSTCGAAAAGACTAPACDGQTTTSCAGSANLSAGVSCGSSTCTNNSVTGEICNGLGTCTNTSTGTACDPALCTNGSCSTSCAVDSQCASDGWCNNGTCAAKQPNGAACPKASACTNANCADGFCCNTACTNQCEACNASGSQGTCVAITGAPRGARAPCAAGATACSRPVCDGATRTSCDGTSLADAGAPCGSNTCVGTNVSAQTCDGLGDCLADTTVIACDPFQCVDGGVCGQACSTDSQCAADGFCSNGVCAKKDNPGVACSAPDECASGECVDGYCCNVACSWQCQACDVPGLQGTCAPVTGAAHGTRAACAAAAPGSCTFPACNGQTVTSCAGTANTAIGVSCGANACTGPGTVSAQTCNGVGACTSTPIAACDPFLCAGGACTTGCTLDGDCASDAFCKSGACAPKQSNGAACTGASACTTGLCVDGFCCNDACQGQCEACSAKGSEGTCVAITGAPSGTRAGCGAGATVCETPVCDGDTRTSCAGESLAASGTSCGSNVCAGTVVDQRLCDGAGGCASVPTATNCDPFECSGGVCTITCAVDGDCASDAFCQNGVCASRHGYGAACTGTDQCASGLCVDGLCCNVACTGQCEACNSASNPGTCVPITGLPHGGRAACPAGANACAQPSCDGTTTSSCAGATNTPKGVKCGTSTCSGTVVSGQVCDGAGDCSATPTQVDCDPALCAGGSCTTSCATDGDCAADGFCNAGACETKLADGTACARGLECTSRLCVDGECCNGLCGGECQACDSPGALGTCVAVTGAPHGARPACPAGTSACSAPACDGTNASACTGATDSPKGAACGAPTCDGLVLESEACDGLGNCDPTAISSQDCDPFLCTSGACTTGCATDADCASDGYCAAGKCVKKALDAVACTSNDQCSSGFCVDGYCCNNACSGQCQACDQAGVQGTCTPIVGAPRGSRTACSPGTAGNPCSAAQCDGATPTTCAGFVGSGVTCGAATCVNGSATVTGTCDGAGACKTPPSSLCGAYACGATACNTSCTVDSDCALDSRCDTQSSKCVSGSSCGVDGVTLTGPTGTQTSCAPYKCEGSACVVACKSVDDCVSPAVCDPSGACVAPSGASSSDTGTSGGGCGCEAAGARGASYGGWALALVGIGATRRRRRRRVRRSWS